MNWTLFQRFLEDKSLIILSTHLNPDGDGLGSELALADYCRQQGVQYRIINVDPTPRYFQFLDPEKKIEVYDASVHNAVFRQADALLLLDVSELDRIGAIKTQSRAAGLETGCVDHHIYTGPEYDLQLIDTTASSTGELVFRLLDHLGADWTRTIVQSLYTCILTDTGSFRFSNTTAFTHRMAARLIENGADYSRIYQQIYESDSPGLFQLKGKLLTRLHYECKGRFVWYVLSQALLCETGVELQETEGFSDIPRRLRDAEISIMFTELGENLTKASFRSKGRIPVNELARRFGGGGHQFASGASFEQPLKAVVERVVRAACEYMNRRDQQMECS
ncbi:MAG: bifunctional oligoribonuclease/PAP phosphatase NrnA [candidate division KSB1 bacterium]|nr:bifunctional oligoribonuclease/PAP phosphatase NrnA [candidate division KSB1 bacterium]